MSDLKKTFLSKQKSTYIVIAMFALVILSYYMINKDADNLPYDLGVEVLGSLFIGLIVYFTWNQTKLEEHRLEELKKLELKEIANLDTEEKIKNITKASVTEVHRLNAGLREIDVEDVFKLATQFITESSTIRVIGTAKQDYTELNTVKAITNYLDETINRSKKVTNLKYRRITSLKTTDTFIKHLVDLLDVPQIIKNKNFKIMVLDDFVPAYTYLIIDEKFLMLTLNYSDQSVSTKHYYSQNHLTVQNFIKHFKSVWYREMKTNKIITNSKTLLHFFQFRKRTNHYFETIKENLTKFENFSTFSQEHVIQELKQTSERVKGLSREEIEVHHTISNGNLLRLFCIYLKMLKNDDTYDSISFRDFWEDIVNENRKEPNFINRNIEALNNGAKISRILIVDKKFDKTKIAIPGSYENDVKKIIHENINLGLRSKNPSNFKFKIYFTERHDFYRQWYYNFALIKSKKEDNKIEKILFEPCNNPSYDSTKILYHVNSEGATSGNVKRKIDVNYKFENTQSKLDEIESKWNSQILNNEEQQYLELVDNQLFDFSKENSDLKRILGNKYYA